MIPTAEEIARSFHAKYEELAPTFDYTTREETRTFDPESINGRLMIAVCEQVMIPMLQAHGEAVKQEETWHKRGQKKTKTKKKKRN